MTGYEMAENLMEQFDDDMNFLEDLLRAIPDDKLKEYVEFIARMNDMEIEEEE